MPVVYDVGALRAVERRSARMLDLHRLFLTAGSVPLLPTIVLGQLWRGLPRAATLTRVLKGCRPQVPDVITAKLGGQLCGLRGPRIWPTRCWPWRAMTRQSLRPTLGRRRRPETGDFAAWEIYLPLCGTIGILIARRT